jgi:large subunit ribosomal protein L21
MFAVVRAGGKQYIAVPGEKISLDASLAPKGESVVLSEVLLVADGDNVSVGTPLVAGVTVRGTVVREGRGRKTIVYKYKAKKRYKKKRGHRQPFCEVMIESINTNSKADEQQASPLEDTPRAAVNTT